MTKYIEKIRLVNGVNYKINTVPGGGSKGQVLTKSGSERHELEWVTPEVYDDTELVNQVQSLQGTKADKESVYTKEQVDSLFQDYEVPSEFITEAELAAELDNYALFTEIPVNISELENDAEYITIKDVEAKNYLVSTNIEGKADKSQVYTKSEIDGKLTGAFHYKGNVNTVTDLPNNAQQGDVYNDLATGANYAFNGTEWDKLSETIDLSIFYTKTETDNKFTTLNEVNSQGFLKQDSLTDYAKISQIPTDFYTQEQINIKLAGKSDIEHTQSTNSIDTLIGYIKDKSGSLSVDDTLNEALSKLECGLDSKQQVGDYALNSNIPTNISQLNNDLGYITDIPEYYVTEEQLQLKGYVTDVSNKQNVLTAGSNIEIKNDTISCTLSVPENDNITIQVTDNSKLQTVATKTLNDIIKFDWIGTLAEYEADLENGTITDNTVCFVTDD